MKAASREAQAQVMDQLEQLIQNADNSVAAAAVLGLALVGSPPAQAGGQHGGGGSTEPTVIAGSPVTFFVQPASPIGSVPADSSRRSTPRPVSTSSTKASVPSAATRPTRLWRRRITTISTA